MRLLDRLLGRFRRSHARGDGVSRACRKIGARKQAPPLGVEQLEARTVMDAAANMAFVGKAYMDLEITETQTFDKLDDSVFAKP